MSNLREVLRAFKKIFSCCYKTVNIVDNLTGGEGDGEGGGGSGATHNENNNNVTVNIPEVSVQHQKMGLGKTKILVDKGDNHDNFDYNQPVQIHIAGSVHMAPGSDFVIHADRHNRGNSDYNSYDISESSSESSPLFIDTEKMLKILSATDKRKLELDYDDIKASPKTTGSVERIDMGKAKTVHPKITSAVKISPKEKLVLNDDTSETLSMLSFLNPDSHDDKSDTATMGDEPFDIDKPLHHSV